MVKLKLYSLWVILAVTLAGCGGSTDDASVDAFLDRTWKATSYQTTSGQFVNLPEEPSYTFTFLSQSNNVEIQFDCNFGGARFEFSDNVLITEPIGATELACGNSIDQQTQVNEIFIADLFDNESLTVRVDGRTLSLRTGDNRELLFSELSVWELSSYQFDASGAVDAVADAPFTFSFTFNDKGERIGFTGFDGCTVFGADNVLFDGNVVMPVDGVSVDNFGACTGISIAYDNQFNVFYDVIGGVSFFFEERESKLVISSLTDQILTFDPCRPLDPASLDSMCRPR